MGQGGAGAAILGVAAIGGLALVAASGGKASAATPPSSTGTGTTQPPLDPGIDPATAAAVYQALASTSTAACPMLQAFATSIASKWPIASQLLTAKATQLGCTTGQPPTGTPPGQYGPGQSLFPLMSSSVESDVAYAFGIWLNKSGILGDPANTTDLSWWTPDTASTGGGDQGGGGPPGGGGGTQPGPPNYGGDGSGGGSASNQGDSPGGTSYSGGGQGAQGYSPQGGSSGYAAAGSGGGQYTTTSGGARYVMIGANGTPSTAATLVQNPNLWASAITALQWFANNYGVATPPGLPGAVNGVLDGQTFLSLMNWLEQNSFTSVVNGTDSGVLGSMDGSLPGFDAQVQNGVNASQTSK